MGAVVVAAGFTPPAGATSGATLWTRRFNGVQNRQDEASAMVTSPDGTLVYVTGSNEENNYGYESYETVAYSAVTGATVWFKRYSGSVATHYDRPVAMAISNDGTRLFITGTSFVSGSREDWATVAYEREDWRRALDEAVHARRKTRPTGRGGWA